MTMPLRNFCLYKELSTGALLVGCFSMFYSMAAIFLSAVSLVNNEYLANRICILFEYYDYETIARIFCYLIIIGKSCGLIAACLLIAGSVKRRKHLLAPWLAIELVSILTFGSFIVFVIARAGMVSPTKYIVMGLLVLVASIYKWTCVYAFYRELAEESVGLKAFNKKPVFAEIYRVTDHPYPVTENNQKFRF